MAFLKSDAIYFPTLISFLLTEEALFEWID